MRKFDKINRSLLTFSFLIMSCLSMKAQEENHTLWYTYPAEDWKTQALHLGNGYMGASFYGGVQQERFDISEESMWYGGPGQNPEYNYGIVEGSHKYLSDIRISVVEGDIEKADKLVSKHFVGDYSDFGSFTSIGQLYLEFPELDASVESYKRSLDLSRSLASVSFVADGVTHERNYFASYPDRVMAFQLQSNQPGALSFLLKHDFTQQENDIKIKGKDIQIFGKVDGNGMNYHIRIHIDHDGGQLMKEGALVKLVGANSARIYYSAATEYRPTPPTYRGGDPEKITKNAIESARKKGWERLLSDHIADYVSLYKRVELQMDGDPTLEKLPTDERFRTLQSGMTDDAGLKTLLFNLGRYLLISTSRPGTLPSGLQGLWIPGKTAAWSGNYQSNINIQEMYWTAGPLDLPECQEAYINWIQGLVVPGRKVAKAYYDSEGWVSHTTGNIWGFASPGSDMLWGMYPSGANWHCQHLWSQFEFTQDLNYLKKTAYPIMKEAALFWTQNLVSFEDGLIIAPTVSAEHGVDIENGKPVEYAKTNGEARRNKWFNLPGAYQDIQMVYDLFSNTIEAATLLETDSEFVEELSRLKAQLLPLRIGKYGQLQEWAWDVDNPRDHHRHIAHMYALMPGRQIDPFKTPELAKAAERSLQMRGYGFYGKKWPHMGGNWNKTWRIWCYARLGDGETAAKIFNDMVTDVGFESLMGSQSGNLQVDGSMSTPGFMAEMLMQSHQGEIHLLPALPVEWPAGKITGLVARGGYKVDLAWRYGQLTQATIWMTDQSEVPVVRIKGVLMEEQKDKRIEFKILDQ